jgi:hypothetical protein
MCKESVAASAFVHILQSVLEENLDEISTCADLSVNCCIELSLPKRLISAGTRCVRFTGSEHCIFQALANKLRSHGEAYFNFIDADNLVLTPWSS